MNLFNNGVSKKLSIFCYKYKAEIFTSIGICGMGTAVIFGMKAHKKASDILKEKTEEKKEPLTKTEVIKAVWKQYTPTVLIFGLSAGFIIYANRIQSKRAAALATAYTISESTLRKYQHKVEETLGEKKHQELKDELDQEELKATNSGNIIITNGNNTLCYDSFSKRLFRSDINFVKNVFAEANNYLLNNETITLNELYIDLNLDPLEPEIGDEFGWYIGDGLIKPQWKSMLTDNDEPCFVIKYDVKPKCIKNYI